MNIRFLARNKVISRCVPKKVEYFSDDSHDYLTITCDNTLDAISVVSKNLTVQFIFQNKFGNLNILNSISFLNYRVELTGNIVRISGQATLSDDYYPFDKVLLNHLIDFWGGTNKTFSEFQNESETSSFLMGALLWNGVPENIDTRPSYVIDFGTIQGKNHVFIVLGEAFVGKRGYAGANLAGFQEFLLFNFSSVKHKSVLRIENFEELSKVFEPDDRAFFLGLLRQYFIVDISI